MAQPDFNALAQGLTMAAQQFTRFGNIPAFNAQNDLNQIRQQLQQIATSIQGLDQRVQDMDQRVQDMDRRLQDMELGQDNIQQNQQDLQNEFRYLWVKFSLNACAAELCILQRTQNNSPCRQ